jgi:hypothetical protein
MLQEKKKQYQKKKEKKKRSGPAGPFPTDPSFIIFFDGTDKHPKQPRRRLL